jgi:hypothetical protein
VRAALDLTLAAWLVLEVGLRVREALQGRGRTARDRGTRLMVALSLGAAVGFAASRNATLLMTTAALHSSAVRQRRV